MVYFRDLSTDKNVEERLTLLTQILHALPWGVLEEGS